MFKKELFNIEMLNLSCYYGSSKKIAKHSLQVVGLQI
jgi:hypothetical protein